MNHALGCCPLNCFFQQFFFRVQPGSAKDRKKTGIIASPVNYRRDFYLKKTEIIASPVNYGITLGLLLTRF
jgi:hypothetical protein